MLEDLGIVAELIRQKKSSSYSYTACAALLADRNELQSDVTKSSRMPKLNSKRAYWPLSDKTNVIT